jgi:hypothetical protein
MDFIASMRTGDRARRSSARGQVLAVRPARRRGADASAGRRGRAGLVAAVRRGTSCRGRLRVVCSRSNINFSRAGCALR